MGENETKKQNVIEAASSASSPAVIKTAASQIIEIEDDAPQEPPRRFRPIPKWKNLSYTTRVTMAFALIAGMTVLVAVGVLSFVWEQHFQSYTRENVQITAEVAATRLSRVYNSEQSWNETVVQEARVISESHASLGMVVTDARGRVVFDSTVETSTPLSQSLSLAPKSPSQVATAQIIVGDHYYGTVRMWVYGSSAFLREADEQFRNNSYQAMALASILAIMLASILGFFFARTLVKPINRMTQTAKAIEGGDLKARTGLKGEDEISHLGETFDSMAESIEKDRELERRLTTDVAHELRTPLMAIQATVEAMVDGVFEPNEERLDAVNSEVLRLSRLVDALLKLSRLENRSTPMKEEVLDVGELVESIVTTHEPFIIDSGLSLNCEIHKNVLVKGDADMIRQATANLISNAVRYTPEGGTITLKVSHGELMANIVVEDTGIGLSPEEIKMVFSRFWRADSGRNRAQGGLGIGLAVVKEIVDRHHGWVQVEGKKGEGARFTIHLPLYKASKASGKAQAKDKKAKANNKH